MLYAVRSAQAGNGHTAANGDNFVFIKHRHMTIV